MNKELQELNRIRKCNALAEKVLLSMVSNAKWWDIHTSNNRLVQPDSVIEICFNIANEFIRYSENRLL